ncbi:MAG TPA: T9SS type A sorting domain-containing protein [Bacteroidetes bacterium]|nr:T9SS type A sorting domain-containing protein [Bacteroidota bacterium]
MVNVATGGGYIDYWGDYSQIDYQDYTKSQDEYGFVIVEVQAGGSPHFTLKRISRGDKFVTLPNQLRDSITVYKHNLPPNTPTPVFPVNQMVNPDCITLEAAPYSESEGDLHMASQWQVSASCLDFSVPVYEAFRNHENWFNETNTQAGDVLTDERVHDLPANSSLCWRVRFRDHSLGWSPWSGPTAFSTGASSLTSNLLQNPGAENDTLGWVTTTGFLEALTSGQCAGVPPHTGLKYFAVGALCNSAAYAEAFQAVDVSSSAAQIDSSLAFAHWGGWLRNWNGADLPAFFLKFYDGNMLVLDSTSRVSSLSSTWKLFKNVSSIPPQTRYIHFILTGSRNSGLDNDAYLDDLYLNLNLNGCQSFSVTVEPPFRKQAEMRISPNPLLDAAKIEVAVPAGQKWEASLFDIQGKIVQQLAGDNCSNIKVLRNGLPAGTYTLKVKIAQRTWLRKLIMLD